MTKTVNMLLVEDNFHDVAAFKRALRDVGYTYNITDVRRAENALKLIEERPGTFDLIVTDHLLPGMTGLELCRLVIERNIKIPIVLLTGAGSEKVAIEALELGVTDYITKDNSRRYLNVLHMKLAQALAKFENLLGRIQAEAALRQKASQLQIQNKELDAFAHTVAHDLRNPIALIIGYAEVARMELNPEVNSSLHKYLSVILQHAAKASTIIDELLLLATVRTEEVPMERVNMNLVMNEVRSRVDDMVMEYDAELIISNTWPTVEAHALWIEEVWVNYITNAIKYGGRPPVVTVGWMALDNNRVQFWVSDNGNGIAQEQQKKLFLPLTRLKQNREQQGHGLGLSIVERIVSRLGGTVGVESNIGEGSRFYFTLPKAPDITE